MKKLWQFLFFGFVGFFGFIFFLYLSFPYDILKESVAVDISKAIGINVAIEELEPSLLIGAEAKNVKLNTYDGKTLTIPSIQANLSILSLFAGKVGIKVRLRDKKSGTLDVFVSMGIMEMISPSEFQLPSDFDLSANRFEFGEIVNFVTKMVAGKSSTNPLLKPVLEKITFGGNLVGAVELNLNAEDFSRSTGAIDLKINGGKVDFDPSFSIPDQVFEKAGIKLVFKGGNIILDPSSRFKSPGIDIALTGKIIQKSRIDKSLADISIKIDLFQKLKDQFGFIVNAVTGASTGGSLKIRISGPLTPAPQIQFL